MLNPLSPSHRGTLLACQVGLETYHLPLAAVARIARGELLEKNDDGPSPWGWLPDGELRAPVWSLSALLGSRFAIGPETGTVLLLGSETNRWGLVVDRVHRAGDLEAGALLPLPGWLIQPASSPFLGVVAGEHGLRLRLDPERLDPRSEPVEAEPTHVATPLEVPRPAKDPENHPAPLGTRRMILFSTSPGGEAPVLFGLSLSQVEEILRPQPLLKVPGAEPSFLGLVPWRREAVPILDLSLRMGAGPSFFEGESRFLIARGARSSERLGFAVRPEIQVVDLPLPNRPSQRGRLLDRSLVRGVFELEAGTVFFPDLDRFLMPRPHGTKSK